jgi:Ricin-type beta-trefoil lectin domain-like
MSGTVARNRALSFSAMLIAATGLVAASAFARTPVPQNVYSGPGRYEIENVASGKVLDLNRQDQRTVIQWPRTHAQSQLWDIVDAGNGYVYIKSAVTGLVMDIDGGRARDGARVITSQPSGSDSQLWKVEGKGGERRFTSRLRIALDLPNGSHDDGVEYQAWNEEGKDSQRFRFVLVGGPAPANPNTYGADSPVPEEKRSYERGYHSGAEDFKARLRRTYVRHKGQYNPQWEEAFIEGYYDGYDSARPDTNVMRGEEKDSYDDAYRLGQKDYRDGREPSYVRYADRFDPRSEPFFRRGYADGYYSAR